MGFGRNLILGLIIILAFVIAVYFLAGSLMSEKQLSAGVRGLVTIGPTCPVQRIPPDPRCADRPYKADFVITNKYGYVVARVSSGTDGKFEENLLPGQYRIAPVSPVALPRASAKNFSVLPSGFVEILIQFDSGIR